MFLIVLLLFLAVVVLVYFLKDRVKKDFTPVRDFKVSKYLGLWYEIARLDFHFEKNLDNTTARYTLNKDGSIEVLNSGYSTKTGKWKQALGKAKFKGKPTLGALKVSFFPPFYSDYTILELDTDYKFALVAGKNLEYLWILSREKQMPLEIKDKYVAKALSLGFDTQQLVWVDHLREDNPYIK
ncbi:lipocalin family protein [Myroides sp. LJL119]